MKKSYLLFAALLASSLSAQAQQTTYEWNFDDGIPADFKLYDEDGRMPSSAAKQYGFKQGDSWNVVALLQDQSNQQIWSNSYYTPVGQANDWIVTPAVKVESDNAYFCWTAANFGKDKGGYKVLLSTQGQTVEDFTDSKVLYSTATGEEDYGSLYDHIVSLKEYVGQTVYIAVVNNATNRTFLIMDDFAVKDVFETLEIYNATNNVLAETATKSSVSVELYNPSVMKFTQDVTLTLTIDGKAEAYTKTASGLSIAQYGSKTVTFSNLTDLPEVGESLGYTVTATYTVPEQGEQTQTFRSALSRLGSVYDRKPVLEEGTGTWCGWCPRGMVTLEYMKEQYPDFIGVAAHYGDIMQDDVYGYGLARMIKGFPEGLVNRTKSVDMGKSAALSAYKSALTARPAASLQLSKPEFSADSTTISVDLTAKFAFNHSMANKCFRFAYVLTEDNVRGTTDDYTQQNYYAGGSSGVMGGFESLPSVVPASQMVYNDVARYISGSFYGVEESVPATLVKDQEVMFPYTIEVPKSVLNKRCLTVIALLIDAVTGEIWNADRYAIDPTGIESVRAEADSDLRLFAFEGELFVTLQGATTGKTQVEVYSLDGQKVKDVSFDTAAEGMSIPMDGLKGTFVVRASNGQHTAVQKVVLQ